MFRIKSRNQENEPKVILVTIKKRASDFPDGSNESFRAFKIELPEQELLLFDH